LSILHPVFVLVALTALTLARLAHGRLRAVGDGRASLDYFRAYRDGDGSEPEHTRVLARHYDNLLQAPMLFYVAAAVALATGRETPLVLGLAWAYAALRVVHSVIHTTNNRVRWRFQAFIASWVVLVALWVVLVFGGAGAR
jgi:hypothetical protein